MEHRFHLTRISANEKLGGLPASTTSADSCPSRCSFRAGGGCYGDSGPISLHWGKVTKRERGVDLQAFCEAVSRLPADQLWRHNQVGDLPGDGLHVHLRSLQDLTHANRGRRGFTYTHYDPSLPKNQFAIRWANWNGFTVNLSAESLEEADRFAEFDVGPVVVTLPADTTDSVQTPGGRHVTVCPATVRDDMTCAVCGLCQVATRKQIVGFPAHGRDAKKVEKVFWLKGAAVSAAA